MSPTGTSSAVALYWLPLGAGAHVVRRCGRAYEAVVAAREHRHRADLYHAALQVVCDGDRYVIESAPAWERSEPDRGVVVEGPVGLRWLGHTKWFRYEVRRWHDGVIPDLSYAVDGPCTLSRERRCARRVLDLVPEVPALTWGRDELGTGDMWNSNALISWLLARGGLDIEAISPPAGGRAPGWAAGVDAAGRLGLTTRR